MSAPSCTLYSYFIFFTLTKDDNIYYNVYLLSYPFSLYAIFFPFTHSMITNTSVYPLSFLYSYSIFFTFTQDDNELQHLSALIPSVYNLFFLLSQSMIMYYNVYLLSYPLFIFYFLYFHTA